MTIQLGQLQQINLTEHWVLFVGTISRGLFSWLSCKLEALHKFDVWTQGALLNGPDCVLETTEYGFSRPYCFQVQLPAWVRETQIECWQKPWKYFLYKDRAKLGMLSKMKVYFASDAFLLKMEHTYSVMLIDTN